MSAALDKEAIATAASLLKKLQGNQCLDEKERFAIHSIHNWLCTVALEVEVADDAEEADVHLDETAITYLQSFRGSGYRSLTQNRGSKLSLVLPGQKAAVALPANPELKQELTKIDSWEDFDVFNLQMLSDSRPLETVGMTLFQKFGLIERLKLPQEKLNSFLKVVEASYNHNPYHNSTHAADIVQTVGCFVTMDELSSQLTDLEVLSLLLAAVVHDVGHPGVTNDYLIKTKAEPAIVYNDNSINENGHLSMAFRLLAQPDNNFMENFKDEDYRFVRRSIIDMVLATDMAFHRDLLKDFAANTALWGKDLGNWTPEARSKLLQMLLHTADISNPVKPLNHSIKWADCVLTEFFSQGDKERSLGLSIAPLCNRDTVNVPMSQLAFLEHIVKPCFELLNGVLPATCAKAMEHCQLNKQHWEDLIKQGKNSVR